MRWAAVPRSHSPSQGKGASPRLVRHGCGFCSQRLPPQGFSPLRTVLVTFVPDEEIGGNDGMGGFVSSARFAALNVGLELDEGWATPGEVFPVFYAERCPWWFTIRAEGEPGHGSKLYDGGAMERLQAALARIFDFRAQQFDKIKVCANVRSPCCSESDAAVLTTARRGGSGRCDQHQPRVAQGRHRGKRL